MLAPTFSNLNKITTAEPSVYYASGSPSLSGHPHFYKYLWQIFSADAQWEGGAFFAQATRLCQHDFLAHVARLLAGGHSCLAYGERRPRQDPRRPRDLCHPKWQHTLFAPSWDDDTDPVVAGGHK